MRTMIGTPVPGTLNVASAQSTNPRAVGGGTSYAPGDRIQQYELIRELGRGAMGVVFAARDTRLGRRVAIKFLQDAVRGVADRFLVEARATAQCTHENIVVIHDVDEDEVTGTPYMVLEYLEGQSLFELMNREIPLAPSRAIELALPIARALARAHERGIVHRDLKPDNVFLTHAGGVKVLDFGIAKALGSTEQVTPGMTTTMRLDLTQAGGLIGTPPYMAPEQLGTDDVDHRCDLWALGIILFQMLVGRHPVSPLSLDALILNAASDAPMPSVLDAAPHVPPALAAIVDRCLQKSKYARFGSAGELARALEAQMPGRRGRSLADDESPYPGLAAFQESDADRFFGRTREIERAIARLRERPLTGVVGASGVGKSSFVRAGVGPALKATGERWDVLTFRPGRYPIESLANVVTQLTRRTGGDLLPAAQHDELRGRLRHEPGYFATLLRERARSTGTQLLLFVDQLEELYTLVPDAAERRAFTAALSGVADDPATPLRVIVSMRSDFLDRLAEDARFTEELARGLVFLAPPDRQGLRDALVEPLEMVGYRFETPAMIDDMLGALGQVAGALPLLQFAAAKLWDARDRVRRVLTSESYHAIGGVSGALTAHADEVLLHMSASARKLTERLFRKLVTPERTRALVELGDLQQLSDDRAELGRVIDDLTRARLLVAHTRGDGAGGTIEIVHESLIDRWPTLRRWLDDDHEDTAFLAELASAAKQWDSRGRPAGLLWRGAAMEEARRWDAARVRDLPARERAFLDAGLALARRSRRVRRVGLIGTIVLLGAVASGASVALVRVRAAEQEASTQAAQATAAKDTARAEANRAQAALAAMQEAERVRLAAEARATSAQKSADEATAQVNVKAAQVARSREELEAANQQLEAALAESRRQGARAAEAQRVAESAMKQLKDRLEAERAAYRKLQDEMAKQKLSTKLK